jgi:DNA-binding transcriptional MerR regulator
VDKAPDAFRTISEVADDLDVPQHVLRFWETRFAQIKPMKRGGGRRYYRPDDVDLLRGIRHLLYGQGYTIRGVQRLLKDKGLRYVQAVWRPEAPQPEPDLSEPDGDGPEEFAEGLGNAPAEIESMGPEEPAPTQPVPLHGQSAPRLEQVHGEVAAVAEPSITAARRQRLLEALRELDECRRLLESALKDE